ncbi:alpha/beta fold hydrolase [Arthrobacter sp. zg-Y750]|uniref:alpha/beta fold hydrolase n=1 Tax=Arthrobacter sp. zg-Y750 TaxID=2894189 RepID=UPI002F41C7DF|nr:alpha/beta hydrolase [Arthrobacter sp. zg-Y750]
MKVLGPAEGPALVLVQGFGCDQVIWDRMLPEFTDKYKVVLFDHVGTGGADPTAYDAVKYAALAGYLSDLEEVLAALDLQDATIVGHSIAGTMALAAAVDNPRIGRLVLLCTSPGYLNDGEYAGGLDPQDIDMVLDATEANYPLWATAAAVEMSGTPAGSPVRSELADRFCRLDPEYVRDFLRMSFTTDIRHLLPLVHTPALILQTPLDPLTPGTATQHLRDHLPGSTFALLEGRGSMPHVSSPGATARAILKYLGEVHGG